MEIEIVESPIRFRLHGVDGEVEGRRYAEVGLRLVNETWRAVKGAGLPTTGIKHRGSPGGGEGSNPPGHR